MDLLKYRGRLMVPSVGRTGVARSYGGKLARFGGRTRLPQLIPALEVHEMPLFVTDEGHGTDGAGCLSTLECHTHDEQDDHHQTSCSRDSASSSEARCPPPLFRGLARIFSDSWRRTAPGQPALTGDNANPMLCRLTTLSCFKSPRNDLQYPDRFAELWQQGYPRLPQEMPARPGSQPCRPG